MMQSAESVLYPRHLLKNIGNPGSLINLVGVINEFTQTNKGFVLQCDPETKERIFVKVPTTIEFQSLKKIKYIEVRGKYEGNGELQMVEYTDLLDNFDLKIYNEMMSLAEKEFGEIFNYN